MTGLAIVVFLNQYPLQPRERDYAYAGSFYAFAIWIGLGVMGLIEFLQKKIKNKDLIVAGAVVGASFILVPGIMAQQGWDDHDRSGKYAARDFAFNYLKGCDKNSMLITFGDNDTFPLWYVTGSGRLQDRYPRFQPYAGIRALVCAADVLKII